MKRLAIVICSLLGAGSLGACADDGYYRGGPGYAAARPWDVWYDGYYGPFAGGYWEGNVFLFRRSDGRFTRDDGHHFRHERFARARGFRSMPTPSAAQSGANASATTPNAPPRPRPH